MDLSYNRLSTVGSRTNGFNPETFLITDPQQFVGSRTNGFNPQTTFLITDPQKKCCWFSWFNPKTFLTPLSIVLWLSGIYKSRPIVHVLMIQISYFLVFLLFSFLFLAYVILKRLNSLITKKTKCQFFQDFIIFKYIGSLYTWNKCTMRRLPPPTPNYFF